MNQGNISLMSEYIRKSGYHRLKAFYKSWFVSKRNNMAPGQ